MNPLTGRVNTHHGVVLAIGEHVGAEEAFYIGGGEGISVDKSADCGVVISALQVVETSILLLTVPTTSIYHQFGKWSIVSFLHCIKEQIGIMPICSWECELL